MFDSSYLMARHMHDLGKSPALMHPLNMHSLLKYNNCASLILMTNTVDIYIILKPKPSISPHNVVDCHWQLH